MLIDVIGYEGRYKVSDEGFVVNTRTGRILKPDSKNFARRSGRLFRKKDYCRVTLCKDNKPKKFSLSRLVAIHFIPNPDNKPEVNHIDGDRLNNSVSNLEWVTQEENLEHARKTGLFESCGKYLKTDPVLVEKVISGRNKYLSDGVRYYRKALADDLGLTVAQVKEIVRVYK